jgi:hypothetical protein
MTHFNDSIHAGLIALGYTHNHFEEVVEDDGDSENGPHLNHDPAFDSYKSHEDRVIVDENGHFVDFIVRDHAQEKFEFDLFREDLINNASGY